MTDTHETAHDTTSEPVEGKKRKPKKVVAEGEGGEAKEAKPKRARRERFPDNHVITVLVANPKHGACAARFDAYRTGMTIKEYVDILSKEPFNRSMGLNWADIWWDTDPKRNFIHVGPTVVDVPPPPPPKEPKPKKKKLEVVSDQPSA
jgi:hypothetical protein